MKVFGTHDDKVKQHYWRQRLERTLWHWLTYGEPAWKLPHRSCPARPLPRSPWSQIWQDWAIWTGDTWSWMEHVCLVLVLWSARRWSERRSNDLILLLILHLWSSDWTSTSSPLVMFSQRVLLLSVEVVSFGQIGEKVSENMLPADSNRPTSILLPAVIDRTGIGE